MIEQIHIHNFQCHKDLTLYLGRSTVLQGDSNHGKTAVLRALYWVMYNEPQGTDFISHWAYKKLKNGIKFLDGQYTEVSVTVDGHTIVRHRGEDFNGYVVDGVRYEALRGGVPDAVTQILNLSDVSVQKQLDAPFLLSMTPGEAALFLNKLANLEDVSGILLAAKKSSLDATTAAGKAAEEAAEAEKLEKQYDWVDEVQELAEKCSEAEEQSLSIKDRLEKAGCTVEEYDLASREQHPLDRALRALPVFEDNSAKIKACQEGIAALRAYRDADGEDACMSVAFASLVQLGSYPEGGDTGRPKLEKSLDDYDAIEDVEKLREAESEIEALGPIAAAKQTPRAAMERSLADYDGLEDTAAIDSEIKELERSLEGQVCPTCGRPYSTH